MLLVDIEYWIKCGFVTLTVIIVKVLILYPTIRSVQKWWLMTRKKKRSKKKTNKKSKRQSTTTEEDSDDMSSGVESCNPGVAGKGLTGGVVGKKIDNDLIKQLVDTAQKSSAVCASHSADVNATGVVTPDEQADLDIAKANNLVNAHSDFPDGDSDHGDGYDDEGPGTAVYVEREPNDVTLDGPESNDPKDLGERAPQSSLHDGYAEESQRDAYDPKAFRTVNPIAKEGRSGIAPCGCYQFKMTFFSMDDEMYSFLQHLVCTKQFWMGPDGHTLHNVKTHLEVKPSNPLAQVGGIVQQQLNLSKVQKPAPLPQKIRKSDRVSALRQQDSVSPESSSDETEQRVSEKLNALNFFPDCHQGQYLKIPFASDMAKGLAIPHDTLAAKGLIGKGGPANTALSYLMSVPGIPIARMKQSYLITKAAWEKDLGLYTVFNK